MNNDKEEEDNQAFETLGFDLLCENKVYWSYLCKFMSYTFNNSVSYKDNHKFTKDDFMTIHAVHAYR